MGLRQREVIGETVVDVASVENFECNQWHTEYVIGQAGEVAMRYQVGESE